MGVLKNKNTIGTIEIDFFTKTEVKADNFIDVQGANTNFSGGSGDINSIIVFSNESINDRLEIPTHIILSNNKKIVIKKENFLNKNGIYYVLIKPEERNSIVKEIEGDNQYSFFYENEKNYQ